MKKTKKQSKQQMSKAPKDDALTLKDLLNDELRQKLKMTQKQLQEDEVKKQEEEEARKREERRQREKNKSFEELLNESNLKWDDYKK